MDSVGVLRAGGNPAVVLGPGKCSRALGWPLEPPRTDLKGKVLVVADPATGYPPWEIQQKLCNLSLAQRFLDFNSAK